MSGLGALLGALFAAGVLLAVRFAPLRRPRLAERLAPYLGEAVPAPSWSPARALDRLLGGGSGVRRRLAVLRSPRTVAEFRAEQASWGIGAALTCGIALGAVASARAEEPLLPALAGALIGLACGVAGRDTWLTTQVRRRDERLLAELPVIAELLALAVTAGAEPLAALSRVCTVCRGELSGELSAVLAAVRAGDPLAAALQALADRTSLGPLARFAEGLVSALKHGTPLAEVLRAQAGDVRAARRRAVAESGRRRATAALAPVVCLILPVTVLFALYPA